MNWFLYDNGPRNEMVKSIKRNKALGIDALMQVLHVYLMFMNKLNTNCLFLFIEKEVFSLFKIAKTFRSLNLVMLLMLVITEQSRFYRYSQRFYSELRTIDFLIICTEISYF